MVKLLFLVPGAAAVYFALSWAAGIATSVAHQLRAIVP